MEEETVLVQFRVPKRWAETMKRIFARKYFIHACQVIPVVDGVIIKEEIAEI